MHIRESIDIVSKMVESPQTDLQWVAVNGDGQRITASRKGAAIHLARKANWTEYDLFQEVKPPKQQEVHSGGAAWVVSCVKSGKWWRAPSREAAVSLARKKGLLDYEVYPEN